MYMCNWAVDNQYPWSSALAKALFQWGQVLYYNNRVMWKLVHKVILLKRKELAKARYAIEKNFELCSKQPFRQRTSLYRTSVLLISASHLIYNGVRMMKGAHSGDR